MSFLCRLYICFLGMFGVVFGDYNWSSNPGNGTEANPYQISTAEQLISIGSDATLLDKYFILTNDIDISGYSLTNSPIAPDTDQSNSGYTDENRFEGSIDGQGHRIYNLTITRSGTSYNIGLIGLTTGSWEILNLGLENLTIDVGDSSEYLGGLVARGYGGTVSDSYVIGSITSGDDTKYMGGLMGLASVTNISNCYTDCVITNGIGSSLTGGAIGNLSASTGLLEKCYSLSTINSPATSGSIGALVGILYNNASVNYCYYLNTAGGNNTIGDSRTAAQLKQIANYTNWEFNTSLGNQGHWRMRDDRFYYPYLAWEFSKGDFYGDFKVDLLDFAALSQSWQTYSYSVDFNYLCDTNANEVIDPNDLGALCEEWLIVD